MRKLGMNAVLTMVVLASLCCGVGLLIFYAVSSAYKASAVIQEQALAQTAQGTANVLQLFIDNTRAEAANLARLRVVREALEGAPENAQAMLDQYVRESETLASAIVIAPDGRAVAGAAKSGDALANNYADRDYFKAIMAGQSAYLGKTILRGKTTGDLLFIVAHAVRDQSGKTIGLAIVCPYWERFTARFIDPVRFGQSGYGYMLDGEGRVIAHARDKSLLLAPPGESSLSRRAVELKNGLLRYSYKGEEKFMAVAEAPATGWVVCMSASEADMMRVATEQRNVLAGLGVGVLAVVGALIVAFNRLVVIGPLRRIMDFASRVAEGDLTAELAGRFRFELAGLAHDLKRMVAELHRKLAFSQGVLNSIPIATTLIDNDRNILWVNRQACAMLEKTGDPASYVGQRSGEFILGDATKSPLVDKTVTEGAHFSATSDLVAPSGKTFRVRVDASPVATPQGEVFGGMVFWNDITAMAEQQRRIENQNALIAEAADKASAVSDRMAQASQELSAQIEQATRGAQEQDGRVRETVTAVGEMNNTIIEVARNAGDTATGAQSVRESAREGADLVVRVIGAIGEVREASARLKGNMHALGEQAQGIGAVLGVISDIADQTNLLALNAAIEAARAGDAGRGFAVVADEVRKLAEKTMLATKEVGEAIVGIQRGTAETARMTDEAASVVDAATVLAEDSGRSLANIVGVVESAGDQIRAIATAAEEQSASAGEITRSMESISRIVSETADAMGHSSQAVAELAELAQSLSSLVAEIKGGGQAALTA